MASALLEASPATTSRRFMRAAPLTMAPDELTLSDSEIVTTPDSRRVLGIQNSLSINHGANRSATMGMLSLDLSTNSWMSVDRALAMSPALDTDYTMASGLSIPGRANFQFSMAGSALDMFFINLASAMGQGVMKAPGQIAEIAPESTVSASILGLALFGLAISGHQSKP